MASVPARPDLLIVARDRPQLYERFRRMGVRDTEVEIIIDRREAVVTGAPATPERRRRAIDEALRTAGWVMVPGRQRARPVDFTPAPHDLRLPVVPPTRTCYLTLNAVDVECLAQFLARNSDAYLSLQAALDQGDGTMSVRCSGKVAEELLFTARWNCPDAVAAIRAAMASAAE